MTDETDNPTIVLASGSPRRRWLVEKIGWRPVIVVSDIPEERAADETPREYTERLAFEKAEAVARSDEVSGDEALPRWILAADTIVTLEGEVLEKPADESEAFSMLSEMAGQAHDVLTSFCWLDRLGGESLVRTVRTRVNMRELSDEKIRNYVATGEPMDKAGSYGIQDLGRLLVEGIEGSFSNVVGLPVSHVVDSLEEIGANELHPFNPRLK